MADLPYTIRASDLTGNCDRLNRLLGHIVAQIPEPTGPGSSAAAPQVATGTTPGLIAWNGKEFVNAPANDYVASVNGNTGTVSVIFNGQLPNGDQLHLSPSGSPSTGGWLLSFGSPPGLYLSSGGYYNGTSWVATNTSAWILVVGGANVLTVFLNTVLTVGNTFVPTQIAHMTNAGAWSAP